MPGVGLLDFRAVIDALRRNLGYALRTMGRRPGSTIAIVLTLALGIGASSAVFTAMDAVLFEPLPFSDADRLVSIRQTRERATVANVAPVRLEDWFERSSSFEAMMGYTAQDAADTFADPPENIRVAGVSPRMLEVFGITPILGRGFVAADHVPGTAPVAMISESLWERRFDRDPGVIGTVVDSGDQSAEIVGVLPAGFAFPDPEVEVWGANVYFDFVLNRGNAWYTAFGRLKPGVTVEEAQADLTRVQANLAAEYPDTDRNLGAEVVSLMDTTVGGVRPSLWLMFGAVFVLLIVACTNIAALLLARAADRQRDVAMRLALGASRRAISAHVLTEAALLALIGAALGLFVAELALLGFKLLAPEFPRIAEVSLSRSTVLFVSVTVVAVTLLCGMAPALQNARQKSAQVLTDSMRMQVSGRHSWQWGFVGVQVALSVALLSGAGLLIRSFQALTDVDLGYDPDNVLTFRISGSFAEEYATIVQTVDGVLAEVGAMPGVEAAATSSPVPGVASDGSGFQFGASNWDSIDGGSVTPVIAEQRVVSPDYFETMRIPFLAGSRCLSGPEDEVPEIAVNETFVRSYLPDRPAVGAVIRDGGEPRLRIGAVVGDAREFGARRAPVPVAYSCSTVIAYPPLTFLARTAGDPMSIVGAVRQRIAEIEPSRSVYDIRTLNERVGNEYAADRLRAVLIGVFAGAALALVCLGIYGTLSYIVGLRRREVGLRVALGALQQTIVSHFLFKAFRVVGLASLAGLVLAFIVSRGLASQLFGVSPNDPLTLIGVVVVILFVAGVAALTPAVRAARVDPMSALREE